MVQQTLCRYYLREIKTYFPVVFFKLLKAGDNSNVLLVNGSMLWYIYTVKYYSAVKRNKVLIHIWINLKCLMLIREGRLKWLNLICFHHMTFQKRQNYRNTKQISGHQWLQLAVGGVRTAKGNFQGNETVLYLSHTGYYATVCVSQNSQKSTPKVQFYCG